MIQWRFPSNDYGENKGINDTGVAIFRGTPLSSLAREICQNSLDAARETTIRVVFDMFSIPSDRIPGKDVLIDTFNRCLAFWSSQKAKATKEFFTAALNSICKDECTVLRISDFNTTGLTGSREPINTDWTNLTKSSGASDKKGTAGGSYGIGKFAPFACSDFSTVFYSTYDENEECAYQGVSRLVTFTREDGQNTQGVGYFGEEKNTPVYEQLWLDPNFKRENGDFGTDIYIIGYKYGGQNWQKDIIVSILNGFLGAIWNEKLEVCVGDIDINKENLKEIMDEYRDDLTGYTDKYYEVLTSDNTKWDTEDFLGLGEVSLGLLLGVQDTPTRIAMIRKTGMKIMDKDRLPGHVPFMGVMFINGDSINERLRALENPEHTRWEPERSPFPVQAQALLKSLNDFIKEKIEKLINSGTGEAMDAVGVGTYIPDTADESPEQAKEEVVSDKVVDVEIKKAKKRSTSKTSTGQSETESEETVPGHMEPGGHDEDWFHPGDGPVGPEYRPPEPAHPEEEGDKQIPKKIAVGISKFVYVALEKNNGKYVLKIIPEKNGTDGIIELFMSAETAKYPAPLKKVSIIGVGNARIEDNKVLGVDFKKDQELRLSIELDYTDYCSLEVGMYANKE
ncbi:MAG: hypothetical protein IJM79_02330 [Erysipelotrichaceae bacterium]|nr:hypothetical protein [Erysipelotrichaceae bacterium]